VEVCILVFMCQYVPLPWNILEHLNLETSLHLSWEKSGYACGNSNYIEREQKPISLVASA